MGRKTMITSINAEESIYDKNTQQSGYKGDISKIIKRHFMINTQLISNSIMKH